MISPTSLSYSLESQNLLGGLLLCPLPYLRWTALKLKHQIDPITPTAQESHRQTARERSGSYEVPF